jgi:catechol 2,3-dioxygenase-like lactoylglutathione lyase family enzyme
MSLLGGVHHVSLNVADVDEASHFYEDVLGLTRLERPDFGFPGAWFDTGRGQIHLLEVDGHTAPDGQHFAFQVDDIEAVVASLVEKGIDIRPPSEGIPGAGRQAFLKDPSGNLIELNQPDRVG